MPELTHINCWSLLVFEVYKAIQMMENSVDENKSAVRQVLEAELDKVKYEIVNLFSYPTVCFPLFQE